MKCRICGSENLDLSLSLGEMYVSDFVKDLSELKKMPMEIFVCDNCGLEQIGETPELDSMYKKYWYKSGINNMIKANLEEIVPPVEIMEIPGLFFPALMFISGNAADSDFPMTFIDLTLFFSTPMLYPESILIR